MKLWIIGRCSNLLYESFYKYFINNDHTEYRVLSGSCKSYTILYKISTVGFTTDHIISNSYLACLILMMSDWGTEGTYTIHMDSEYTDTVNITVTYMYCMKHSYRWFYWQSTVSVPRIQTCDNVLTVLQIVF